MQHCSFSIEDLHLYGINLRKNNISRPLSNQALMVAQAVGLSIHLYSLWVIPHTGEWFLHLPAFSASRTATTIKIHYFFRKCNVFYFILCLIFFIFFSTLFNQISVVCQKKSASLRSGFIISLFSFCVKYYFTFFYIFFTLSPISL